MKKLLATITLVFGLLVSGLAQSGFVMAGGNNISVGQLFATPAVSAEASSSPGLQNAYVITVDYEDDRCEGYAYNGYGFSVPATDGPVDTLLTNYDPEVRSYLGYDSITNLTLYIHLTKHAKDTTVFLADYNDPRFGLASGDVDVTYTSSEFGCDSVVALRVYRMEQLADTTITALPGRYVMELALPTPAFTPNDFYEAGGQLTPGSDATYTNSYPTGETTPLVWTAVIADSTATFTHNVIVNEPDCESLHPQDGSGNTYDVVRLIHDCWLKTNLQSLLYADGTDIPDVHTYPGVDPVVYGRLYSYDAATGHYPLRDPDTLQGACPTGWHIPSYAKVVELLQHFEADDLMSTTNWLDPGNNITGFGMQPSGYYTSAGHTPYQDLLVRAYFWTYSPGSTVYHACQFGSACGTFELTPSLTSVGYSVRCLKD